MRCELINKHFTLIHFVQIVAYKMWPLQFIIYLRITLYMHAQEIVLSVFGNSEKATEKFGTNN